MTKKINGKRIAYIHNVEIEVDTRAQKEIASLVRNGAEVLVCAWNKNIDDSNKIYIQKIRGLEIKIENLCTKVKKTGGLKDNLIPLIKYQFKLINWLRKNRKKFDYIHAVDMDVSFIASLYAHLHKKKFIYDIFDDYADCHADKGSKLHRLIRWIDKGVIQRADAVLICSEKRREQLATIPKKLVIIHNSPDITVKNVSHSYNTDSNKLNIAYVGNLFPGRMTMELAQIVSENNDYEFYCGGAGEYESELQRLTSEFSNIHFFGRMKYEEVISMESQCDVIPALYDPNFPNHKYAAPNKFYEALSLGKPTIMARDTGMDDAVKELNSGVVIEFSKHALEEALAEIWKEISSWREKEKYLKESFNNRFSWNLMESRLIEIYAEV